MNNKYKLTLLGVFITVFAVVLAVSVKADTTTNGDDDSIVTADTSMATTGDTSDTTNGGDDILVTIDASMVITDDNSGTTNGGDDIIGSGSPIVGGSTATTTNGDDDIVGSVSPITGGGSTATTTNGDDDIYGGGTTVNYKIDASIATGKGTITCNGSACSSYPSGTSVTLTANPDSGYTFTSWGGACSSFSGSTCTLTINADMVVQASFSGGSSGGGGSYSSGGRSILAVLMPNTGTSSCPLITTYMKFGGGNDQSEVAKLQAFLNDNLGLKISVNGMFDIQTMNAVEAFQTKYLTDIMGPWSATRSSGFVYITTLKKINQIACNSPFILSTNDLAIINSYKSRLATDQQTVSPEVVPGVGPVLETGSSTPENQEIGGNVTGPSQTAAVVNASIFSRLWNFIVGLFK